MYVESEKSLYNMQLRKEELDCYYSKKTKRSIKYTLKKTVSEIVMTFIKSGLRRTIFKIRCQINKKLIFDKQTVYISNDDDLVYQYKNDYSQKKIVIYTAIFGKYDELKEPKFVNPYCDYVVFTDQPVSPNSVWKKMDISIISGYNEMDAYHLSKIVKILPHLYFKDYEYSIWVDGTTTIIGDLVAYIDRMDNHKKVIGMFDNPVHDCIYTEANFLIYYNRVPEKIIKKQINEYKAEGYPSHNGMFECTVIVRKHNDILCRKIMENWWEQIIKYSMRDQISFPYVLWKNKLGYNDVYILGANRNFDLRLSFDSHLKTNIYRK